jgi:predicted MFS family arabinose efflux permease
MTTQSHVEDRIASRSYRSVLSLPGAPRLFASALIGRLPQGTAPLAILLLVRGATHSYAAAGVAVGAFTLTTAAMAPVQGRLVDRFGRLRVLAPSGVAQGLTLTGLVALAHAHAAPPLLVLAAGLAGAFLPPIAASVRALLGEVFEDTVTRERAYALESVAQELVWVTGPLLVAAMIAATSPSGAALMVAGICIAGTVVFVRSPLARDRRERGPRRARGSALSSPGLRAMLPPVALTGMGLGAVEVGLPSLALHAGSRSASGLLLAVWSAGSLTGGLWYGTRSWRSPLTVRYRNLLLIAVAFTAPLIAARTVPAGIALSLLAGLTIAPMFSCQYLLVSRTVTPGSETEAFTWIAAALVGGIGAGSAAGGGVIDAGGVAAPFVLACLATGTAALFAIRVRRRLGAAA